MAIKKTLLGGVAGLLAVGTASAADLPVKAKAAEYVKVCSTYGAGFYYIPGTDTCLKVGGYITADFYVQSQDFKYNGNLGQRTFGTLDDAQSFFKTRGAIQLDSRTQTEYGTVRTFFEGRFDYGQSYGITNGGTNDEPSWSFGRSEDNIWIKFAYIQFAGFTFGRATSAFDFNAAAYYTGINPGGFYSDITPNLISYTADLGNGFSATISVEDGYARDGSASYAYPIAALAGYYEPQQVPDVVANVLYKGSWGEAKVAAAFHDLRGYDEFITPGYSADDYGWAVLAGVKLNLGEATTAFLEGAYADGALGYVGLRNFVPNVDAFGDSVSAWYIYSGIRHYWTPTVFTSAFGNYAQTDDYASLLTNYVGTDVQFTGWNVGANIGWVPVKGLVLSLQYDYTDVEYDYEAVNTSATNTNLGYEQSRFTFTAKRNF